MKHHGSFFFKSLAKFIERCPLNQNLKEEQREALEHFYSSSTDPDILEKYYEITEETPISLDIFLTRLKSLTNNDFPIATRVNNAKKLAEKTLVGSASVLAQGGINITYLSNA